MTAARAESPGPERRAGAPSFAPFASLRAAAESQLLALQAGCGLDLVMFTRAETERDLQVVEAAVLDGEVTERAPLPWSGSLCTCMIDGAPAVAPRVADVPAYAGAPNRNRFARSLESYVGVPVLRTDGSVYGSLCGFGFSPRGEELRAALPGFTLAARMLATLLARDEAAQDRLAELVAARDEAERDPLTGLHNRRGFDRALHRALARTARFGTEVSLALLDVDGLKQVNDSRGHPAGDALLREVAVALSGCTREGDTTARVGGDEFALLCEDVAAPVLAERLETVLRTHDLRCSVGAAGTTAVGPDDRAAALLQAADDALYAAKRLRHLA